MNRFLNKLERKLGKYAIPQLSRILIGGFLIGYIIQAIKPDMLGYMYLDPMYIFHGQVWRLFTWFLVPPGSLSIFTLVMLFFYFSIGRTLEITWGDFRYNVYIFGGMLISILASFATYGIMRLIYNTPISFGGAFSTYYICTSLFLAYAMTYPNMQVLLMFVIPIRVKWLGIIYGVYIAYDAVTYIRMFIITGHPGYLVYIIAILASIANFLIFFLTNRNYRKYDPREIRRKREFKRSYEAGIRENQARREAPHPVRYSQETVYEGSSNGTPVYRSSPTRHRCVICGRTEVSNPELTFRYCSKCSGDKEYCQDHLFTHEHS